MPMLSVKHVKYTYDNEKIVLNDVNYEFERGRIYAILGPSGCGKTTLLSLLGGLDAPTEGEILFDGRTISDIGYDKYRHDHVAFVFQNYNLVEFMTAIENVQLIQTCDAARILTEVGLQPDEQKRSVVKLSGGQQQRVAIARALASSAPIILADEPTGNLDEDTADTIMDLLIERTLAHNKCLILVTHSQCVAARADKILSLSHGTIREKQVYQQF